MNDTLHITTIYPLNESFMDYPDDESNCITLYCMGCDNSCAECHNKDFKDPNYTSQKTRTFTIDELIQEIKIFATKANTNKLVLCGGDFLASCNLLFTKQLLNVISSQYDICIYTGHSVEYCMKHDVHGFTYIKCGNFVKELQQPVEKTDTHFSLASKNQEIYNSDFRCLTTQGVLTFN